MDVQMEWSVQKWPNKCHWWRRIIAPAGYYHNTEVCVLILNNRRVKTDEITNQLQTNHRSIYEITYHSHYIISVTTQQTIRRLKHLQFLQHVSAIQPSSGKTT
jgi:hypothetical protein